MVLRSPVETTLEYDQPMRRWLPVLIVGALIAGACGSGTDSVQDSQSSSDPDPTTGNATTTPVASAATTTLAPTTTPTTAMPTTTAAPTTIPVPEVTPGELAGQGPYAVGVVTRALTSGNAVEVWYPADEAARGGTVAYTVRSFLPPAIGDLVPDTIDDTRSIEATRDAPPAPDGPYPIVLFSHGSTSFRLQSSVLAQHLASWGIVTAATDHPSRDLFDVIGGTAEGQRPSIDDLRELREYLTTLGDDPVLGDAIDNSRVALGGHSAGGGTVAQMANDDGILGYVSYASGLGDEAPDIPSLFMAGELDMVVDPVELTVAAFDRAPAPSWLWVFGDAGHLAFSDLCAVGSDGATLIDLAEAAGLGALVDDRLRILGTDGCEEPNRPVIEVWPGVHQAATGFYRWVFGIDPEPVGLDASVVADGVAVTAK
jgi:predicted dienelactone hydrolase